jgi:hypothetical protein
MPRVFGLGLSRTGTFSLHVALQILGYRSVHFPKTLSAIESHDAAVDTSVIGVYPMLKVIYPDAKFILTTRNPQKWAESIVKHWEGSPIESDTFEGRIRQMLYGDIPFTPEAVPELTNVYRDHILRVQIDFANQKDSLLVMDITDGDGWDVLCPFLGLPKPSVPFPHVTCC